MPGLAEHQRAMLDLVKGRGAPPADPYLARVAASPELELLREIAVFWRMIAVEDVCASLARLLKALGTFQSRVENFYREEDVSTYTERAGEQFCLRLRDDPDPLVRAMVEFELASMRLRTGDSGEFVVDWDRNPDAVFAALAAGGALPPAERSAIYRLHLSRALPGLARCECIGAEDGPA